MTDSLLKEKREAIEKYAKQCFDDIEDNVKDLRSLARPQVSDDYDTIHQRLLRLSEIESSLAHVFENVSKVKSKVDVLQHQARVDLEDAQSEVLQRPQFRSPTSNYMSRPEVEAKLRSHTVSELHTLRVWDEVAIDIKRLVDVLRNYQQEASKAKREIDTRLKILSMRF